MGVEAMPDDLAYSCDCCGCDTEDPVSVHLPIGGGGKSPLDLCPECATTEMQKMLDRLGHEHGSKLLLEIKSLAARREAEEEQAEGEAD